MTNQDNAKPLEYWGEAEIKCSVGDLVPVVSGSGRGLSTVEKTWNSREKRTDQ